MIGDDQLWRCHLWESRLGNRGPVRWIAGGSCHPSVPTHSGRRRRTLVIASSSGRHVRSTVSALWWKLPNSEEPEMTVDPRLVAFWKPPSVGDSGLDRVGTRKTRVEVPPPTPNKRSFVVKLSDASRYMRQGIR